MFLYRWFLRRLGMFWCSSCRLQIRLSSPPLLGEESLLWNEDWPWNWTQFHLLSGLIGDLRLTLNKPFSRQLNKKCSGLYGWSLPVMHTQNPSFNNCETCTEPFCPYRPYTYRVLLPISAMHILSHSALIGHAYTEPFYQYRLHTYQTLLPLSAMCISSTSVLIGHAYA
jgi:hypothetical protein